MVLEPRTRGWQTKGSSIKDVRNKGGGGVKQKRTHADMGGGGSSKSGRPYLIQTFSI